VEGDASLTKVVGVAEQESILSLFLFTVSLNGTAPATNEARLNFRFRVFMLLGDFDDFKLGKS
jgi:hypothetical protein